MKLYNRFAYHFALPMMDLLTGQEHHKYLELVSQSQYWQKQRMQEYQLDRFIKLIHHSYKNVPFYKKIFDERGLKPSDFTSFNDITLLPILSKDNLRKGIKTSELIDQTADKKKLIRNSSSGSTGEPFQFFLNREAESIRKATAIRAWQWMGFHVGDSILRISPLERKKFLKRIQDRITKTKYLQVCKLDETEFSHISQKLMHASPRILRSYPDPLYLLTNYMVSKNIRPPKLTAINTTGSTLYDHYRESIESYFGCRVFDSFSCEGGPVVSQCSESSLYHTSDEYAFFEVVDKDGNPAQKGRLITTDLWNYATPFIRYDTQDIVELAGEECGCNRGLRSIKKIYGRASDILVTPNNAYLYANSFTGHFQGFKGIEQYQIHQKNKHELLIKLKTNNCFDADMERKVLDLMHHLTGDTMKIEIHLVEEIPLALSGKRRFLIRDESVTLGF